jgi:hypothetical protein
MSATFSRSAFRTNPFLVTAAPVSYDRRHPDTHRCYFRFGKNCMAQFKHPSYMLVEGGAAEGYTITFSDQKQGRRGSGWCAIREYAPFWAANAVLDIENIPNVEMEMRVEHLNDTQLYLKYDQPFTPRESLGMAERVKMPLSKAKAADLFSVHPADMSTPRAYVETPIPADEPSVPIIPATGYDQALYRLQALRASIAQINSLVDEVKGLVIDVVDGKLKARIDL